MKRYPKAQTAIKQLAQSHKDPYWQPFVLEPPNADKKMGYVAMSLDADKKMGYVAMSLDAIQLITYLSTVQQLCHMTSCRLLVYEHFLFLNNNFKCNRAS